MPGHPSSVKSPVGVFGLRRQVRDLLGAGVVACMVVACGGGNDSADASDDSSSTVTAPAIVTQPVSKSVTAGGSVTLSVTATGTATLTYQWYKDGTAVAGATAASYTIAAVAASDGGSYYVVVSNGGGSVTSSTATLLVLSSEDDSESWDIATGANGADQYVSTDFGYTVAVDLATLAVSTSSARLVVGTATDGATPITLDGSTVMTLTRDAFGLSIASDMTDGSQVVLELSGTYAGSVTLYTAEPLALVLNGASITSSDGPALNIQSDERVFMQLADGSSNTLVDGTTWSTRYLADGTEMDLKGTVFSEGALIVGGEGALTVEAASKHAIASDGHLRLTGGTVTVAAEAKDGIRVNDAFVMDDGTLTVTTASGAGKGIKVEGKEDDTTPLGFVAINGGELQVRSYDKAVTASWESDEDGETTTLDDDPDPRVTINGGTITISTFGTPYEDMNTADGDDSLSPEGIESKSLLTVNDGTLEITTTDDALNAGTGININGGRIHAKSTVNDGIDSNGQITIAGGIVVADGAAGVEGGIDCDQSTFAITGGVAIGIGGHNSTPTRSATTQNTVVLANAAANALLVIKDSTGNVPFAFLVPEASQGVVLSSPSLATGTAYTVYSGGAVGSYSELFAGMYLGASAHTGGSAGKTFTISSTVSTP